MEQPVDLKFGVIGYGSFGKLLVDLLCPKYRVVFSSSRQVERGDADQVKLDELVKTCDVIFLCIPLSAYNSICDKVAKILNPNVVIVDVASVKVKPEIVLPELLPNHTKFFFTHPLFGPESAKDGSLDGLKLVVTNSIGGDFRDIAAIFEHLGAEIVHMSAEDHDKQMAYTHALTFYISHALARMHITEIELTAPSYKKLLALQELDTHHSEDLFRTIQNGNPFAAETRARLMSALVDIENSLHEDN